MKNPTLKQKVEMYENFLHKINSFIVSCNNEGIRELINNADTWSYMHRVGNGEISDRKQQQVINNAFWKLLDTPNADKETIIRQAAWEEMSKTKAQSVYEKLMNESPTSETNVKNCNNESFPFVINIKTIAGQSVEETCHAAVRLSKRLRCLVETEINDVTITVGGLMTEKDAYESWLFYSKQKTIT